HIGNAQAIADRRVRRRATALTQYILAAGKFDDGMDGEKVGSVSELADQGEFVIEGLRDIIRNPFGITFGRTFPCEMGERFLWAREGRASLIGIFMAQLIEREGERFIESQCLFDRLGRVAKETRHLGRRLEITFGVCSQAPARLVNVQMLAYAG